MLVALAWQFIALPLAFSTDNLPYRKAEEKDNADASPKRGAENTKKSYTPAVGSAERKAIALALHPPCERELKQEVIVKFSQLRVAGDWAVAWIQPLQPNGKRIDYAKTKFKERMEDGAFDDGGEALLRRRNGRWTVVEWRFGNTDTEMFEWIKRYRAPLTLVRERES